MGVNLASRLAIGDVYFTFGEARRGAGGEIEGKPESDDSMPGIGKTLSQQGQEKDKGWQETGDHSFIHEKVA